MATVLRLSSVIHQSDPTWCTRVVCARQDTTYKRHPFFACRCLVDFDVYASSAIPRRRQGSVCQLWHHRSSMSSSDPAVSNREGGAGHALDILGSLDETRSLLNASRFPSTSDQELGEGIDEPPEPPGHELQHDEPQIALYDVCGLNNTAEGVDGFTRDALSTLKHIQALVNMELGRQVRTERHQIML